MTKVIRDHKVHAFDELVTLGKPVSDINIYSVKNESVKSKSGGKVESMITYFDNIPSLLFIQVLYLKLKKKKKILTFFFDVNQSAED